MTATLNSTPEGTTVIVTELTHEAAMRQRLEDIGLIVGSKIRCLQRSPAGDPAAYLICGAVIALRNKDAERVLITNI